MPPKFKIPLRVLAGWLLAVVSLPATQAATVDGNWIWTTPGRNGAAPRESVLSLKSAGTAVTGNISTPGRNGQPADIAITDGTLDGNTLTFKVVRITNGNTNVTAYSGTWENGRIAGKIESLRNGEIQSRDWVAKSAGDQTEATPVTVTPPKPGYDENGHKIVNETHYPEISVAAAAQFIAAHPDAVIIDTRSPQEYAAGHLPNARNYNLTDDNDYPRVLATITDKTAWYVVHSATGHYRTIRALEYFEANHFEHAVAIDGGFAAWKKAGEPVAK
jgi:rhodanese-related sulfurtransferase